MAENVPPPAPTPDGKTGGNFLTKETAGLPNWAWAIVIVLGIGIAYMVVKKKAVATSTNDNIVGQSQASNQSANNAAGYFPTTTSNQNTVPVIPENTNPVYDTNGNLVAFQPTNTNQTTTSTNQTTTDGGTPPPTTVPPPSTQQNQPPPPPPPNQQTVTVTSWPSQDSTLSGIAQHVYGNANLWPIIYRANQNIIGSNPDLIYPGQALTIPPNPGGQGDITRPRVRQVEGIYR